MVQSQHSIVDFQHEFPEASEIWKKESNSIISLSISSEEKLIKLYQKLSNKTEAVIFREPDINNQATSITLLGTPKIRKKLSHLPLSLKTKKLEQIVLDMKSTEQFENLSVYQHGEMVRSYFLDLYTYLKGGTLKYEWKIPDFINDNKDFLLKELNKIDLFKILDYHLYHDCGKPYCLNIDNEGKKHFVDHANISSKTWIESGGCAVIGNLIKRDMEIHLLKDVEVDDFCLKDYPIILLLTGLSEIHANSTMFGGLDSKSFKIKWKHINKRGKAIIKKLNIK